MNDSAIYLNALYNRLEVFLSEWVAVPQGLFRYTGDQDNYELKKTTNGAHGGNMVGGKAEKCRQLISIFSAIDEVGNKDTQLKFAVQTLGISETVMPRVDTTSSSDTQIDLCLSFLEEFGRLPKATENIEGHLFSLHFLIKKYFWLVPSSVNDFVSLYDEIRFAAAVDCILHIRDKSLDPNFPFLLVSGDLAGIQSFIYNISSKSAGRSLRGRSFYLQSLVDDICFDLLRASGLQLGNIVYSSGGKFFLLMPNTRSNNQLLLDKRKEVNLFLFGKHGGGLYFCLDGVAFNWQQNSVSLQGQKTVSSLGDLWRAVSEKTSSHKTRRFADLLIIDDNFEKFFEPSEKGGEEALCSVTGEETKLLQIDENDLTGSVSISSSTAEQITIGKGLINHNLLSFHIGDNNPYEAKLFSSCISFTKRAEGYPESGFNLKILTPNEPIKLTDSGSEVLGFRYFGGSSVAMINAVKAKTIDMLGGDGSFKRVAYLRMDVDNLGRLFTSGIPENLQSFHTYSSVSGWLDWFFSGYINHIRETEAFRDHVNVIYSGGDDLFAVGRWDKIIEFSHEIQTCFKAFTGIKSLSLSAGIYIATPKFPIGKAALLAGEAEAKSKDYEYLDFKKNAVTIFDTTVNWDHEFPQVLKLKAQFSEWMQKGFISHGLIQQILRYFLVYRESKGADLSWKWSGAYSLARRAENVTGEKKAAIDSIKELLFGHVGTKRLRFEVVAVACRWVELEYRTLNQNTYRYGANIKRDA